MSVSFVFSERKRDGCLRSAGFPWGNDRIGLVVRGELGRKDFGLTWKTALASGGALVSDRVKIEADMKLVRRVRSARMAGRSSLAPGGAIVYRGSRADAKPVQKMAKRWAQEPARSSAPTRAGGGVQE